MKDHKQLNPLSVLEQVSSNEGGQNPRIWHIVTPSTSENVIKHKKVEDDSKFTVEKPSCTGVSELQELVGSNTSSQYLKSKRVLQQTKQLLFDCVREVVDTHVWKNRRQQHFRELLGPEELEKLLCENISTWSKLSGDDTNRTTQLLHLDSLKEWSDFELQIKEIGMQIGDTILEDITNKIVIDMI
uniref:DUF4378 domain-containing protein n=1 Tax=Davidia involucrata TaxID=16924 RepID=A0A5B7ARN1_DAVIN